MKKIYLVMLLFLTIPIFALSERVFAYDAHEITSLFGDSVIDYVDRFSDSHGFVNINQLEYYYGNPNVAQPCGLEVMSFEIPDVFYVGMDLFNAALLYSMIMHPSSIITHEIRAALLVANFGVAAQRARQLTELYYGSPYVHLCDGDAFRHVMLSALTTRSTSPLFAFLSTSVIEFGNDPQDMDTKMDFHNNMRGILLYQQFRTNNPSNLALLEEFIHHAITVGWYFDIVSLEQINGNSENYRFRWTTNGSYSSRFSFTWTNVYAAYIFPFNFGFEAQYFFNERSRRFYVPCTSNALIRVDTTRLRTGFIEEEFIVLSPNRIGAGRAFLDIRLNVPIQRVDIQLSIWGGIEGLRPGIDTAILQYLTDCGIWLDALDLLNDITLPHRNNPKIYPINFSHNAVGLRIYMTRSNPITDQNRGRICLGDLLLVRSKDNIYPGSTRT